ncbi:MAG TPA: hypothetical protein VMO00_00195, partial [Methylomirabilota bacterium]|nr:hypothetical protein [Methylomirabilota bacterium]
DPGTLLTDWTNLRPPPIAKNPFRSMLQIKNIIFDPIFVRSPLGRFIVHRFVRLPHCHFDRREKS